MQYLSELVAMYQGKDPQTRKFILAQVLDHVPDPTSPEIVEVLWAELRSSSSVVRRQARFTLGNTLPRFVAHDLAVSPDPREGPDRPRDRSTSEIVQVAGRTFQGCLGRMSGRLGSGDELERIVASLVIGRLWDPAALESLLAQSHADSVNFASLFSLAEIGGDPGRETLLGVVRRFGRERPDLYMLLRGFPDDEVLRLLESAEAAAGAYGRVNVAMALANQKSEACRGLLERLIRRKEGWVTAYALDTLAGFSDPADLPLVRAAYELESHEFIRVQAVRAAGTIPSIEATEFCLDCLRSAPQRIQAAALEALAGKRLPAAELVPLARPLVASEFLRTRVNAILVTAQGDVEAVAGPLQSLIFSDQPLLRLEGAFVLGYLQAAGCPDLLLRMARDDPYPPVRAEAIRSLGRYPRAASLPRLSELLGSTEEATVAEAARALSILPGERSGEVMDALEHGLTRQRQSPVARGSLLKAIGRAASRARSAVPRTLVAGLRDPDARVVLGALDGLKVFGDDIPSGEVRGLFAHGAAAVRSAASVVAVLSGEAGATTVLEEIFERGGSGEVMGAAIDLLGLGAALPHLVEDSRFAGLRHQLSRRCSPATTSGERRPSLWRAPVQEPRRSVLTAVLAAPVQTAPNLIAASPDGTAAERPQPRARTSRPRLAQASLATPPPLPNQSGVFDLSALLSKAAATSAPGWARRWGELASRRWMRVALAVIVSATVLRLGTSSSPPGAPQRRDLEWVESPMHIWSVKGLCEQARTGAAARRARAGDPIVAGAQLETFAGGCLEARDFLGNALRLGSASRLRVVSLRVTEPERPKEVEAWYVLEGFDGECVARLPRAEARLRLESDLLVLVRATVSLTRTGRSTAIGLASGKATLQRKGKRSKELSPGDTVTLE